jgi:hypothetical protein
LGRRKEFATAGEVDVLRAARWVQPFQLGIPVRSRYLMLGAQVIINAGSDARAFDVIGIVAVVAGVVVICGF